MTRSPAVIQRRAELLSQAQLKELAKHGHLHCVQCRRPYDWGSVYKFGHMLLCLYCWHELVVEYQNAFGDDVSDREFAQMREG